MPHTTTSGQSFHRTTSGSSITASGGAAHSQTDSGADSAIAAGEGASSKPAVSLLPHWLLPGTTLEQVQQERLKPLGLHSSQHEALLRRSRPPTAGELQAYQELAPARFVAVWKAHLSNLSAVLLQLDMRPGEQRVADALVDGVVRMTFDFKHTSQQNPECIQKVMALSLDSGKEEVPHIDHWRNLVRSLELSEAQQCDLVTAYTAYRRLMAKVLHERAQISATLRAHGVLDAEAATRNTVVSPECAVLQSLINNLTRERSLGTMLRGYVYGCVLTVVQMARCAVFSYPFFPNAISMLAIMWADANPTGDPHPLAPTPPGTIPSAPDQAPGPDAGPGPAGPTLTSALPPAQPGAPLAAAVAAAAAAPSTYSLAPHLQPLNTAGMTAIEQHVKRSEQLLHQPPEAVPDYMRPIAPMLPSLSGPGLAMPGVPASALASLPPMGMPPPSFSFR